MTNVLAYWVPIELREQTLKAYKASGIPIRLRYRGPRMASVGRLMMRPDGSFYKRTRIRAKQDCLIADATHFSVYSR